MVGLLARDAGTWKDATPSARDAGTWKTPEGVWAKDGGVWVKVWPSLPILTFMETQESSANATTYTFTGVDIGPEAADRLVVFSCHHESGGNFSSATVNGSAASLVASVNADAATALYSRAVPTGTTATIAFTLASASTFGIIGVWTITGLTSATAVDTATLTVTSLPASVNIDVSANGVLIAAFTGGNTSSDNITWTNATEDFNVGPPSAENCSASGASYIATTAVTGRTISANATAATGTESLLAASFR